MKSVSINNKSILNNQIILFFLIMPYFKFESMSYISSAIDQFFNIWRIVSFSIVLILYLIWGKTSKVIVAVSAYQAILFFSTLINEGDYWKLAVNCGTTIGFCMLTELCLNQNSKKYFSCVFRTFFVMFLVNLIILLIMPEGIAISSEHSYRVNFLGIDNRLTIFFIPLMAIACIHSAYKRKKLSFPALLMLVIISATVLITWSATGVVVWFIELIYILFIYKGKLTKYFHSVLLFSAYIVVQIGLVFMRLQNYLAFIIEDVLGKTLTLSGRTEMWDLALLMIARSPILGYGIVENAGVVFWRGYYWYAHNGLLEVLLQGGILALIPFVGLFIMSAKILYQNRKHYISGIVTVALFAYLVFFLTEAMIDSIWLFGLFVIAYHVPSIIEQVDRVNELPKTTYFFRRTIAVPEYH